MHNSAPPPVKDQVLRREKLGAMTDISDLNSSTVFVGLGRTGRWLGRMKGAGRRNTGRLMWRVHWGPFRGMRKLGPMDVRAGVRAWHLQAGWDRDGALEVICKAERDSQFLGKKEAGRGHSHIHDQGLRKTRKGWQRIAPGGSSQMVSAGVSAA